MEEAIEQALEGGEPTLAMHIGTWEDVDELADWQYAMTKPLCLICEDGALLEAALRVYQGRALYEGSLPEEILLPLSRRYGLLI